MGRPRGRKHKLRSELQAVRDKSFENRLRHLVRYQFGACEAETHTIVSAGLDYLRQAHPDDRAPLDILVDIPAGRNLRVKASPDQLGTIPIPLSPCVEHDLDLWFEMGMKALQTARIIRLIEQADRAGGTLPLSHLVSLTHLNNRTITQRLRPLWNRGYRLPVMSIPASMSGTECRLSVVLRTHLMETAPESIRRDLFLSPAAFGDLLRKATQLARGYATGQTAAELASILGLGLAEVEQTLTVIREVDDRRTRARLQRLIEVELGSMPEEAQTARPSRLGFEAYLIRRHHFSPVRAKLLAEEVEAANRSRKGLDRAKGDLVYWAISDREPAGKARLDCELVATVLSYRDPEADRLERGQSTELKVRKAGRLAAQARQQGGLLCFPDLAFLLGVEVSTLQRAIARSGLFVPTRGTIMDIGRGVTHRVQIVTLYVEGYTASQIVQRTQHTYDSVASYVEEFCRVMLLHDRGLPVNHIRKVLNRSLKLVKEYIALYEQLDREEHQWKLNLMRRAAVEQEKKRSRS